MKKLFVTLLFMASTLLLSAQSSDTTKTSQYEYAFIYIDQTDLKFDFKLHYENNGAGSKDSIFVLSKNIHTKGYNSDE